MEPHIPSVHGNQQGVRKPHAKLCLKQPDLLQLLTIYLEQKEREDNFRKLEQTALVEELTKGFETINLLIISV